MILALVAGWSCAEAILFFIVVDVPLSAIALHAGARRAVLAACVAALAAVPGAYVSQRWALADAAGHRAVLVRIPGIDDALLAVASADYAAAGWRAALRGSFSGVPFKLYAHAAGSRREPLAHLLVLTPLLRLPRFLATIALTCLVARALPPTWTLRARFRLLTAVWIVFYAFYFVVR